MTDAEKALTYEEAKRLCRMAFDGGVIYGTTSMQYNCNAVAYDWEHWLKENDRLFTPPPTVEDVVREIVAEVQLGVNDTDHVVAAYAAKLQLKEGA